MTTLPADDSADFTSVPILDLQGEMDLNSQYEFGKAVGAYWRRPMRLDFFLALRPGPDPRPIEETDLARVAHSVRTGGTVIILANDRAAIDIAISVINAEDVSAHA